MQLDVGMYTSNESTVNGIVISNLYAKSVFIFHVREARNAEFFLTIPIETQ